FIPGREPMYASLRGTHHHCTFGHGGRNEGGRRPLVGFRPIAKPRYRAGSDRIEDPVPRIRAILHRYEFASLEWYKPWIPITVTIQEIPLLPSETTHPLDEGGKRAV